MEKKKRGMKSSTALIVLNGYTLANPTVKFRYYKECGCIGIYLPDNPEVDISRIWVGSRNAKELLFLFSDYFKD